MRRIVIDPKVWTTALEEIASIYHHGGGIARTVSESPTTDGGAA